MPIGLFILGVCLLLALMLAGQWLVNADPAKIARALRLAAAGLLGALALFFLLTGKFQWALPLVLGAMALARRWSLPNLGGPFRSGRSSPGQTSDVETDYLTMTLEHDTGVMHGRVRKGPYTGKTLSELDLKQLISLLADCHRDDLQSAHLLETYLDRTEGPEWREAAQSAGGDGGAGGSRRSGRMSRAEALEILGLEEGASDEEVRAAHHRLMLKMHPDRGGSDYLAAKVNEAKDILLGS